MSTQKMVCVKFDTPVSEILEKECERYGRKRNRLINIAVEKYIQACEQEREDGYRRSAGEVPAPVGADDPIKYILSGLPRGDVEDFRFISRQLGASRPDIIRKLIKDFIDDYKKRPFAYL